MNRRTFLKLTAAGGAACALPLPHGLTLASALPLAVPHHYFPGAEAFLAADLTYFDLLLVPAYVAAELIHRGALRRLDGPPHRPHDPEGAFTIPFGLATAILAYRGARPNSLSDLWQRASLWPDDPRLAIGAALLRRGYSPNDTHPGHLAQIEHDLVGLHPRVVRDPVAALGAQAGTIALTWSAREPGLPDRTGVPLPLVVEYDWAVPATASSPTAALNFIAAYNPHPAAHHPSLAHLARAIPLAPLPAATRALHTALWARIVA